MREVLLPLERRTTCRGPDDERVAAVDDRRAATGSAEDLRRHEQRLPDTRETHS